MLTLDTTDHAEVDRFLLRARIDEIMYAPEADDRLPLAGALAMRLDLSPDAAVLLLRQAPVLRTGIEVNMWVAAIPLQAGGETRQ